MYDIEKFQQQCRRWARYNFPNAEWTQPFMGIVEEVGELSHALLKQQQGIRGTFEEHEAEAKDAVGDIVIYLTHLCNLRGWELDTIIEETWNKVQGRDWRKDPVAGGE